MAATHGFVRLRQPHFSISNFASLPRIPPTSLPIRASPRSSLLLRSVSFEKQQQQQQQLQVNEEEEEEDPSAELSYLDPETGPDSRSILDVKGKKLWELVICDNSLSLQYTKYFPNNVNNSITPVGRGSVLGLG